MASQKTTVMTREEQAEFLAERLDVPVKKVLDALLEMQKEHQRFTTKNVKEAFEALDDDQKSEVIPTGKDGKVSMDDVARAKGVKGKTSKVSHFTSKEVEKMAKDAGLSEKDFPIEERSGKRELKTTGWRQITKDDVLAKTGEKFGEFSTPKVARKAYEAGLTVKDFPGVDVIKASMVEAKIASMKKDD